jgi:GDP-L-fucose synthase
MTLSYKKILVTGSSAVLGSAVRRLSNNYSDTEFEFATSKNCDLCNLDDTRRYFCSVAPDAIMHIAAVSGGIALSMNHHASMLRDNTLMTFSVLEAARACKAKKTIMTLTTGMYPVTSPLPLQEESIHDGYPHDSNYGSSFAKRLIDPAIRAYREEYSMSVIGLVPSGIFGEFDNFDFDHATMLASLIRRFYENRNGTHPIVVWGDGSPLREYSYAEDLARIYFWALEHYDSPQILNIGTTEEHSVKDIAFMVAEELGIDTARLSFDTSKPAGIFRKNVDNSRLIGFTGFQYTQLRDGLQKTIRWFCDAYTTDPAALKIYDKRKMEA